MWWNVCEFHALLCAHVCRMCLYANTTWYDIRPEYNIRGQKKSGVHATHIQRLYSREYIYWTNCTAHSTHRHTYILQCTCTSFRHIYTCVIYTLFIQCRWCDTAFESLEIHACTIRYMSRTRTFIVLAHLFVAISAVLNATTMMYVHVYLYRGVSGTERAHNCGFIYINKAHSCSNVAMQIASAMSLCVWDVSVSHIWTLGACVCVCCVLLHTLC